MKRIALGMAAFAAFAVAQAAVPAQADYITNGSFETGDFTDWTLGTQGESCTDCTFVSNTIGGTYVPDQGSYFAMLGNEGSDDTLTQTVSDAHAVQGMFLTYYLANDGGFGGTSQFEVKWDGTLIAGSVLNNPALSGYVEYQFEVFSNGTGSDTLQFLERDDAGFMSLDDVQLNFVPEPGSLALLGSGLIATAAVSRRRRRVKKT
jgi:hypothetical protein